jgi:hypothetical protein
MAPAGGVPVSWALLTVMGGSGSLVVLLLQPDRANAAKRIMYQNTLVRLFSLNPHSQRGAILIGVYIPVFQFSEMYIKANSGLVIT